MPNIQINIKDKVARGDGTWRYGNLSRVGNRRGWEEQV